MSIKNKIKTLTANLLKRAKDLADRYRESKHKTRIILMAIFAFLVVWGVLAMIGMYFSGFNLREGFLDVSGRIEGHEYHAGTKIGGKVVETFVDEGDKVTKGQEIGRIGSKQLTAIVKEAEAQFRLAETEYERYSKLAKRDAVAKIKRDQVEERYKVAKESLARAKADLEDTIVRAPISGTVALKIVREGEVVAAGTPLVTIINMDKLFLKIFLATDIAGKVTIGDEAKIFPDALPNSEFDATVTHIAAKAQFTPKNVETKSERAKLVFEIRMDVKKNEGDKLKPGMPSDGAIKIAKNAPWKKYRR